MHIQVYGCNGREGWGGEGGLTSAPCKSGSFSGPFIRDRRQVRQPENLHPTKNAVLSDMQCKSTLCQAWIRARLFVQTNQMQTFHCSNHRHLWLDAGSHTCYTHTDICWHNDGICGYYCTADAVDRFIYEISVVFFITVCSLKMRKASFVCVSSMNHANETSETAEEHCPFHPLLS